MDGEVTFQLHLKLRQSISAAVVTNGFDSLQVGWNLLSFRAMGIMGLRLAAA